MMRSAFQLGRRAAHTMPDLKLARGQGIPGLFSARGLEIAWFDYQHHLITQLNAALEKHPQLAEIRGLANLAGVLTHAEDPEFRPLAAVAAQAYTNEFFFKSIAPTGSKNPDAKLGPGEFVNAPQTAPVDLFKPVFNAPRMPENSSEEPEAPSVQAPEYHAFNFLTRSSEFGKIENFRELFVQRGALQFGDGAVWLVKHGDQGSLMNTYGWGTPLTHPSQQSEYGALTSTSYALSVTPVLGVNLWEHVYLYDYGVAGKREFLENVFDCIDWAVVDDRLAPI